MPQICFLFSPNKIMNRIKASVAVVALGSCWINICLAGLRNDDSWFNGVSGTPMSPTSSSSTVNNVVVVPPPPPGPTKEELEQKDLREASDDFIDKGNKYYKTAQWGTAVAFSDHALAYPRLQFVLLNKKSRLLALEPLLRAPRQT